MADAEEVQIQVSEPPTGATVSGLRAERAHILAEVAAIDAQLTDINRKRASQDPLYARPEYLTQRELLVTKVEALRAKAIGLNIKIKSIIGEVEDEIMFTKFSFRKDPRNMGGIELRAMLHAQQSVVSHMEASAKAERSYLFALTRAAEKKGLVPYGDDLGLSATPLKDPKP